MKTSARSTALMAFFLVVALTTLHPAFAQEQSANGSLTKKEKVLNYLDPPGFTFIAQSVTPVGGGLRQLTSTYDLTILKDTIISNLPYFGRAYSAPLNPADGGIQFTSTAFEYNIKETKKGNRNILVKLRDVREVSQLVLSVNTNGSALLQVTSNNRQAISFNGYVKKRDQ